MSTERFRQDVRARRGFAAAGLVAATLGLGVPMALSGAQQMLGPLDVSVARQGSTIAVDREGHLLRAFTASDGRWRLPVTTADVDPRFLLLLQSYEDRRFMSHRGVDPLALARGVGQVLRRR